MIGLFEPDAAPWNDRRASPTTFASARSSRTGTGSARIWSAAFSRVPAAAEHRGAQAVLRPGELHPRPRAAGGRGTRAAQLLGRRRAELARHPERPRASARCWHTGSSTGMPRSIITAFNVDRFADGTHNTPAFRRDPDAGAAREEFGAALPNESFTTARGLKQLGALRPAQGGRGVFHREPRLGAPRLVCADARTGEGRALQLGPAELVRLARRGTPGGAGRRGRDGHVLDVEVPRAGPRRLRASEPGELQRRGRGAGPGRLHRLGQRGRRIRGRPHRHPAGGRTSSSSWWAKTATATPRRGCAAISGAEEFVAVTDITPGSPRSMCTAPRRATLLQKISAADLSNDGFPFMSARDIDVGYFERAGVAGDLRGRAGLGAARAERFTRCRSTIW